ncbi:hypothetical protein CTZ28_45250 [Streptomyces shenzhenensis]|uniref:Uncharacterized protein n=1 Tax=Streptomyces shenzhenensis TaxID=943815 RepID=A0A3M0HSB1_9ACTN|nr:hypothetical protein CTZ28_45250 [Streptomyces shenzhenensis]
MVAAVEAAEGSDPAEGRLSPASSGELVDERGCLWTKSRGPLDVRLVKRLVRGADEMIVGEGAGEVLRSVPEEEREAAWALIKDGLDTAGSGTWTYRAYDFRSEDGRILLYVEEFY